MPYCLDCETEYDELLPWCPNCGALTMESEDDWEDVLMSDDLVPVFDATDEVQALLYCEMLEEAGIDVVERPYEERWFEGVMQQGLHSQLLVRAEDAERAALLVRDFAQEADAGMLSAENPAEDAG